MTSSRKTSHSGERPISARSPIASKLSPARPPPERTTSAGPSMLSAEAGRLELLRAEAHRRLADGLAHEQRPAARAVRRRLGALEAALRAVDVAHCPPPRIEPRSPASTCSAAARPLCPLGPDDVDLARASPAGSARCRPPPARARGSPPRARRRPARRDRAAASSSCLGRHVAGALVDRALERSSAASPRSFPSATCAFRRSVRSARRMSIRPCRTRRRREIASSPSSMLREQRRQLGVGERQQVGECFHGCLSGRELDARSCSVAKGSTSA